MRSVVARPLCSRFDEKRDSDEANNHQGGTSGEHVTNMMSRGARSHGYLVVFSDDRTFVWIHGRLLSWAQHAPSLKLETRRIVPSAPGLISAATVGYLEKDPS